MVNEAATGEGGASVYVVTDAGELVGGAELLVRSAEAAGPSVPVWKGTAQLAEDAATGARWLEPRLGFDDLLAFYDWNTWHRRCCVVKAGLTVGLGWWLERGGGGSGAERVYDSLSGEGDARDPVARLLLQPSPDAPTLRFGEVLTRAEVDYHAVGNAYLELVYDAAGRVAEVYHVPARTMRRAARGGGPAYWQTVGTRRTPFAAFGGGGAGARSEILHQLEYDPRSAAYGMPGWVGALASMGLDRTVLAFNTRLFQNSMMAHLAIVVEGGTLSKDGRAAVKQFVRDRATGVENAGRILLIEDERDQVRIRFEKLNLEVKDLMLKDVQNHFRDVVIAAHGVPPRMLGVVTPGQLGATGEVEGQLRIFRETVTRPRQRQLEAVLARVLSAGGYAGYRVRFRELDITALAADAGLLEVLLRHGVVEADRAREVAGRLLAG